MKPELALKQALGDLLKSFERKEPTREELDKRWEERNKRIMDKMEFIEIVPWRDDED